MLRRDFLLGISTAFAAAGADNTTTRTLRTKVDGASAVELVGQDFPSQPMKSLGNGVFEAQLELPPRINRYRYKLKVNNALIADPQNPLVQADSERLTAGSILWHPLDVHQAWVDGKIRRGRLERLRVRCSYPTPHDRNVWVHIPAGYERSTKGLPALYLFHAGGGSGLNYASGEVAPDLCDTLISLGKARPFVTIMPDLDPPVGLLPPNPYEMRVDANKWVGELHNRVRKSAEALKTEIIPAVENKYGLKASWDARAMYGNSGGGYHTLILEADHDGPYAKVLSASAMYNPLLTNYFFAAIDKRPKATPRPQIIAAAGDNDPISAAVAAQKLGNVDEHCRNFSAMAKERNMLHRMIIHHYGHSGGPEVIAETILAAYGKP
ncbi:hypothetical protein F183_A16020 [Bryobacterales bacterium F-183]|nr:hypothetical protein F183_A16020 [Bryobacterales bacterium F-183]